MSDLSDKIFAGTDKLLRPPPKLTLSAWADLKFYLSVESAAEPGRWTCIPYQVGFMNAITDPNVEQVTMMKSARIGYTKAICAAIGYYIDQDPCPIMVVQPTVEDAQGFSKEEIAPMLRDCKVLSEVVDEQRAKDSSSTILNKSFPGGSLTMVGANSGRGFRRVSRRVVIFDEVDGYPPSAGSEGDQIELGKKRSEYYHNRKIIAGSTPLTAGASRIEEMFEAGDQRRYHVPCPQCGHLDILVFREREDGRGHHMEWPKDEPEAAHFVCSANGCSIEHIHKREMLEGGEWIADAPWPEGSTKIHASFHLWAAYSTSPNASWGQIAKEFLAASKGGPEKLKTFINTALGETWTEKGEAPSHERLYNRRLPYAIGTVPDTGTLPIVLLTAGVDVQQDRLVYEVVGWNLLKQSWSIEEGALYGDTANAATWKQLDELLGRSYPAPGGDMTIAMMAVDSGYRTQTVYGWTAGHQMSRVIAVKGVATAKSLIGSPSKVEILATGRQPKRSHKVWPVGGSIAKTELYGWLRLNNAGGEELPPGYCNFPEYGEAYFLELTGEHLVPIKKKGGYIVHEWQMIPGRENHLLDCRVYARAAASVKGLDRARPPGQAKKPAPKPRPQEQREEPAPRSKPKREKGGWLKPRGGRGSFLKKRR